MIGLKICFIVLLFSPMMIKAQDLTGTWTGHSSMSFVKLVIIHKQDSLFGYTYDEGPGWCQASFLGEYKQGEKFLNGRGVELLHYSGNHDIGLYKLNYTKRDGKEHLNGTVQIKSPTWSVFPWGFPSKIFLHRATTEVDTIAFMRSIIESKKNQPTPQPFVKVQSPLLKVDTPSSAPVRSTPIVSVKEEKLQRTSKIVQHIYTDADSVKIALYDNGEVDQDSVTLFFDEAIILNRYMISDKPMELTIAIPKDGKEHSLDLFAHNLGTIPPNTALIIITAGKKRYELRASYDLSTNAKIIFRHQ